MRQNDKSESYNYDHINIGIASPEKIREWSYGEVLRPETINYRTLRPEKDGLFCEKIFGTTKDWECFCKKFCSIRYKNVICDRCGVEVTHSKVRRERMGHIELSSPVAHIWFYKAVPSRIGLLFDVSVITIKSVIYYEKYIVIDPGEVTDLKQMQLLTVDEYYSLREEHGDSFNAGIGADAIRELLEIFDLEHEAELLRERIRNSRAMDKRKLVRLGLLEDFINSNNDPQWMILQVIPVIPPELRPMVQLEGGRFATSDLNDLYRRLINRNNRLKKLTALKAPDVITKNEKRMLQEAVDALFDNARRKRAFRGINNRPLKSLSDVLKGKQGRFRQNLLGKRVDYSGRSVIVVGPELKLHQCGLPRKMAIELFKPFIVRKLVKKKLVFNIKSAKRVIENEYSEIWKILEEVVKEHPVLLNRAPTLHRLGIQAFEPVLTNHKAIRLHPLVCTAYNADFDGDQMAVHIPLSAESQIEAWTLMLSSRNLLDPANGAPITNPTQDMVLGIYNLTNVREKAKGEGKYFGSKEELLVAHENSVVDIQALVKLKKSSINGDETIKGFVDTTPGRVIFSDLFKNNRLVDEVYDDSKIKAMINDTIKREGFYYASVILDKIKELGFHYSTHFGNTISIGDIIIPDEKKEIIKKAQGETLNIHEQYVNGIITDDERYQKTISNWTSANDLITDKMMDTLEQNKDGHNHLYIMAKSGARGSKQQIRQLAGMRGLMAKPSGDIIEMPIISNFKEGLTVLEYFISTHGARKGLSDTALKTADAGYLTRKLVDTAQDVTISRYDCGTINGISIRAVKIGDEIIEKLSERIEGRFSAEVILNPYTDEIIFSEDEKITYDIAKKIDELEIEEVKIRTVVTCEAPRGICQKCYGINLATNQPVDIGEAVGVIASQSIGQPGTQLTMRTFHVGGTASSEFRNPKFRAISDSVILALPKTLIKNKREEIVSPRRGYMDMAKVFEYYPLNELTNIVVENGQRVKINDELATRKGEKVKASKISYIYINENTNSLMLISTIYQTPIEIGAVFTIGLGEFISKDDVIYEFDPVNEVILAEVSGTVRYQDVFLGKTLKEEMDEQTGIINKRITDTKEEHLQPKLIVVLEDGSDSFEVDLPTDTILQVSDNEKVEVGQTMARKVRTINKTSDITGGLPRVQELFEARNPGNSSVIAAIDGVIEVGATVKGKRTVVIKNEFGDKAQHTVASGKALLIRNGDTVKSGESLSEGVVNPHDILSVQGEIALYRYILKNVQEVYKRQGVNINDKHIGVIVRQMLRKVEIIDSGDTSYIVGELVDKYRLNEENRNVINEGGQPASAKTVLLGLTKASLKTESFISSASFQETTKVLTENAIKNSTDQLRGLKENVIIGHKIPAGTGKPEYGNIAVYKKTMGDLDFIGDQEEEIVQENNKQDSLEEVVAPFGKISTVE